MAIVAQYPDSTKTSLEQRLAARARERWPQIASLHIRHRGAFSYIDATLTDATTLKLCRLRYVGSAHQWQFAIYRASHDDYDESVFRFIFRIDGQPWWNAPLTPFKGTNTQSCFVALATRA